MKGGKFFGLLLLLMLAIGAGSYWVSRHGSALECDDKVIEEIASPDGKTLASRLERSCGEGSLATHVLLRTPDAPVRADPANAVYVAAGRVPAKLLWTGERALTVEVPRPSISPDKPQWRNIRITVRLIQ